MSGGQYSDTAVGKFHNKTLGKLGDWTDPLGLFKDPGESAADRAARMEQERQARIAETQGKINTVFDNPDRAREIADYVSAIRDYQSGELNRQKGDTDRQLKFALARTGQIGGSTQRDQQQRFAEDYGRASLGVEQQAQGAGARLQSADQDARARLITLATSGLDATTAAQQASQAMRSNLEGARSDALGQSLGDMFAGVGKYVTSVNDAAAMRRANRDAGMQLYQPSAATSFYYGGKD